MRNKGLLATLAYWGVLIVGLVFIINAIFNALEVDLGVVNTVLSVATNVAVLFMTLVVAFVGWDLAAKKPLLWKVIFLVAAVLGVAGAFLAIF